VARAKSLKDQKKSRASEKKKEDAGGEGDQRPGTGSDGKVSMGSKDRIGM